MRAHTAGPPPAHTAGPPPVGRHYGPSGSGGWSGFSPVPPGSAPGAAPRGPQHGQLSGSPAPVGGPGGYDGAAPVSQDPPSGRSSERWREPTDEDRRQAYLRSEVAFRLARANSTHTHEAAHRYGSSDAIGPHAVLLFWAAGDQTAPYGCRLYTASRMWLDSPEAADLPRLLSDLTAVVDDSIARADAAGRRWHPLGPEASLVNGGDMNLPEGAVFLGVGVSTLDSVQGDWYQIAARLGVGQSGFDLRGQGYARLVDGTALHVDRNPHAPVGRRGVRSTKTIEPDRISYYNPDEHLTSEGDERTRQVWRSLKELNDTLAGYLRGRPV